MPFSDQTENAYIYICNVYINQTWQRIKYGIKKTPTLKARVSNEKLFSFIIHTVHKVECVLVLSPTIVFAPQ